MSRRSLSSAWLCGIFLASGTAAAQDPRPDDPGFVAPQAARVQSHGHYGSSPFSPPEPDDSTFIVDRASGLDTGCTFRSGGPLRFDILVDRALEDPADLDKLKDSGLISERATIRIPAYDIDFNGGGSQYAPERDEVYFNGRLVPEQYLTGDNGIWKLNAFQVPIEWVEFRTAGSGTEPGRNEIEIRIDTANSEEVWCTAIDWAALSFRAARPVVMAHGILSDNTIWRSVWIPELQSMGVPVHEAINPNMGALDSIGNNAGKIAAAVDTAKERWGVDKVNLVTHSKGGLDSRHYVEGSDSVEKLLQLGTPNAGSPLADAAQGISLGLFGLPGTVLINKLAGPAGIQLTTWYMQRYNRMHGSNPEVRYTAMAGDYDPDCWFCPIAVPAAIVGRGDTVVPVWSVHALPYTADLTYFSSGDDKAATHGGLHQSLGVYEDSHGSVAGIASQGLAAARAADAGSARSASAVGSLSLGEMQRRTIAVDQAPAMISLLYQAGDLDLVLISPSGRRIDPAVADSDATIDFAEGEILGGRQAAYSLVDPELGNWTVEVSAASVGGASQPVGYAVNAWFTDPAMTLEGGFARNAIATGESMVLQATVRENGEPVHAAQVRARVALPSGSFVDVALLDDGSNGDVTADDGIYSATRSAVAESGLYRVAFVARGTTGAGHPFSREDFALASVSEGDAQFVGFRDSGRDTNGNGYFDELVVEVDLDVEAAGRYRLFAVLTDSEGHAHNTGLVRELAAGSNTVALTFDGQVLFRNRVNGPYTLSTLRLAQVGDLDLLLTAEASNVHRTRAYAYDDFEHERIQLNGRGMAVGSDTNGNGLYDLLDISVGVDLEQSGYYQWSAALADRSGTRIGFFAGASYLQAGPAELLFSFDGEAIGRNGEDGPYFVTDLLVFGAGASLVAGNVFAAEPLLASQFEGYVHDRTPPTLQLSADPSLLWPPNHRMVPGEIEVVVSDDVDPQPSVVLLSVVSDEPDDGLGDGDTANDIQGAHLGTDDRAVELRAERSGTGFDRTYTLTYEARDAAGNVSTKQVTVTVPHDRN